MYNPLNQYRCKIIRGKSQRDIDDLLPAYAKVIDEITPCEASIFSAKFEEHFSPYLSESQRIKKTFDNHRTEIAGKMFGMYYQKDGVIYASDRTKKFLTDNDQPAFFKDLCYKMQFPNGMNKPQTYLPQIADGISIRPNAFVLKTLVAASERNMILTVKEVGYYILNSYDVLQGIAAPDEVLDSITKDRKDGIIRKIAVEGKAYSYNYQHIKEQINYLELANLVKIDNTGNITLNKNEKTIIDIFAKEWDKSPDFDVRLYDMATLKGRNEFTYEWDKYYGMLSKYNSKFGTSVDALEVKGEIRTMIARLPGQSTVEIGDEGEAFVYEFEKKRVASFNPRLVNRVLALGKTKGLGYDIQSVVAESGEKSDFTKYIEVKTTKRVTEPNINDANWRDSINITRNEWIAAQQHGDYYCIYRVYFVRGNVLMYVINNLNFKQKENKIDVVPLAFRIDFGKAAIDQILIDEVIKNV